MKRVLFVQPNLQPPGGGNTVANWIIEALKREYNVSLLTWKPPDFEEINRFYGTSLCESDFSKIHCAPRLLGRLIDLDPDPYSIQKICLIMRLCKRIKDDYDILFTADNEIDFGRRGIQYVHYPWRHQQIQKCQSFIDLPWYHPRSLRAIIRGEYRPWALLSGFLFKRMMSNLTLVNSDWTGREVEKLYGIEPITLYPPVAGNFPDVPWEDRENGFVCIGRMSGEKKLEEVIDILAEVKSQEHDIHLHLVTTQYDDDYLKRVLRKLRENPGWIHMHENLPREELVSLISSHRYGIHGMPDEHFGIAAAEMVKAGCIVFVPRNGGQMEIVGNEKLMYGTAEEAVEKIVRVIKNPQEQSSIRSLLDTRNELFSTDRFISQLRKIVSIF